MKAIRSAAVESSTGPPRPKRSCGRCSLLMITAFIICNDVVEGEYRNWSP